ncbi:MAG TPA: protein kinase [Gemmatimonas sp.]|nr:protein kinase [Gemmatimonas sp.]
MASDSPSVSPASTRTSDATTGSCVGPFRLIRRVGIGGAGTVWLAEDSRRESGLVALKLLDERWSMSGTEQNGPRVRFIAEARMAARLDHPHIATVFDAGETTDGRLYLSMAFCEGGSLADRLQQEALLLRDALHVARQLASALSAVHDAGIVHRDVKPANVLFDGAGGVRLSDFGIARTDDVGITRTGIVIGTPAYLAPEQMRGERADPRSDLWALGVTLYEMLARRRPFDGESFVAVAQQVLLDAPAPLPVTLDAPPALHILIDRLLAKDMADRFSSARDVIAVIDDLLRDTATSAVTGSGASSAFGAAAVGVSVATAADAAPDAAADEMRAPLTALIGRQKELAQCAALLQRARLVTLTGVGGTGKTRLALELARRVAAAFPEGVHFVSLAATPRAADVPAAVAESLGLHDGGSAGLDEQLARYFSPRRSLLVLDNFEHVLDAAIFVSGLLVAAPQLTVLVTSRAPLRLQGEQELPVPPLSLPETGATTSLVVGDAESTRLFVQRARASRPDFAITDANASDIAAICRRLDGLPLAIELAAARVKLLQPRAILARLEQRFDLLRSDARDVDPRHRTLRDVIDWSYDLLSPDEGALFTELSVFAGGFSLDAAAEVASPELMASGADVLDLIASLADKSLVTRRDTNDATAAGSDDRGGDRGGDAGHDPRFGMLETVREYGLARLATTAREHTVRSAHLAYFLRFAEECEQHLRGPDQTRWFDRLAGEYDNLRAALDFALLSNEAHTAARMAAALQRFWLTRGFLGEGKSRLETVDARIEALVASEPGSEPGSEPVSGSVPLGIRATIKAALGLLTGVRSELRASLHHFEAAHDLNVQAGNDDAAAVSLTHQGWLCYLLGDLDRSVSLSLRALEEHERAGNLLGIANANSNLGWVATTRGPLSHAERRFEVALGVHQQRRDLRAISYGLANVGGVRQQRADYTGAMTRYNDALALSASLGDRMLSGVLHTRRALAMHESGGQADVAELGSSVIASLREIGHRWTLATSLAALGVLLRDAGDLVRAREVTLESLALRRDMEDVTRASESEALLASIEHRLDAPDRARELFRHCLEEAFGRREAFTVLICLEGLALLSRDGGDDRMSVQISAGVTHQRRLLQMPLPTRYAARHDAAVSALEAKLGVAVFLDAWTAGERATLTDLLTWTNP